jgi:hypothetical protein
MQIDHGFGWTQPDEIDWRDYAAEDYLPRLSIARVLQQKVLWNCKIVLDQLDKPHCAGFTGADFMNCLPVEGHETEATGDLFYYWCKQIDGEPNQENGTSIHSLMKVLKAAGRIKSYAFTTSLATVKDWIVTKGPVLVGSEWMDGMMEPVEGRVYPTGVSNGGHAYSFIGYDPATDIFTGLNHWGYDWGLGGRFLIGAKDFAQLAGQGVELAMAVELPASPLKPARGCLWGL